jgi:hypothetical protein
LPDTVTVARYLVDRSAAIGIQRKPSAVEIGMISDEP